MDNPTFSLLCTRRTAVEADVLIGALRTAGFHPVDIATSSHFSIAGVEISYPVQVPSTELEAAREFLKSLETAPPGS